MVKRVFTVSVALLVAACSNSVRVPDDQIIYEVPTEGNISSSGGDPLTTGYGTGAQGGTPIDDDNLNLGDYSLEQQKIDAAIAERELAEARSQLVVVTPGTVPNQPQGPNVALFAQQTTNPVGQRVYDRPRSAGIGSGCGKYRSADEAQRAFLASGGPVEDRYGLDRDGDGFACKWDPEPYRALKL